MKKTATFATRIDELRQRIESIRAGVDEKTHNIRKRLSSLETWAAFIGAAAIMALVVVMGSCMMGDRMDERVKNLENHAHNQREQILRIEANAWGLESRIDDLARYGRVTDTGGYTDCRSYIEYRRHESGHVFGCLPGRTPRLLDKTYTREEFFKMINDAQRAYCGVCFKCQ